MAERKPNNLPWIILGGIGGLVVLGLFGFGMYSGAKAVSDEMSVTIPDVPDTKERPAAENVFTIYVSATDEIFLEETSFPDVSTLKKELQSRDVTALESTVVILRLSEDASHTSLISIKDMLDDLEVRSLVEILRSDAE